jgi:hypothetical protein
MQDPSLLPVNQLVEVLGHDAPAQPTLHEYLVAAQQGTLDPGLHQHYYQVQMLQPPVAEPSDAVPELPVAYLLAVQQGTLDQCHHLQYLLLLYLLHLLMHLELHLMQQRLPQQETQLLSLLGTLSVQLELAVLLGPLPLTWQ